MQVLSIDLSVNCQAWRLTILIQWFKEWDGRPARLFLVHHGRDARATLCVSPRKTDISIRGSRPEQLFTALTCLSLLELLTTRRGS